LLSRMRSGRGFLNDLRPTPDATAGVDQPTLVIATRYDGGVPFSHAQALTAAISHAELVESQADSHFIWLGPDWPAISEKIRVFLTTNRPPTPDGRPDDTPALKYPADPAELGTTPSGSESQAPHRETRPRSK
jgi:TAP-like protein